VQAQVMLIIHPKGLPKISQKPPEKQSLGWFFYRCTEFSYYALDWLLINPAIEIKGKWLGKYFSGNWENISGLGEGGDFHHKG
jgi:hypothetical protein